MPTELRRLLRCRLTPLAMLIGAACALSQPVHAKTIRVTTCADNASKGSLRSVVNRAAEYDVVDLSSLRCGIISLYEGPLVVSQDHLTIQGSGETTIDGLEAGAIFVHTGDGLLTLFDLNLQNGLKYETGSDDARGGCVFSSSSVELMDVTASRCEAIYKSNKHAHDAKGGAIYAMGDVELVNSTISYALAAVDFEGHALVGHASGGGVYAGGAVLMKNSQLFANEARAAGSLAEAYGGGAQAASVNCKYSTIAHNLADDDEGTAYGGGIAASADAYLLADAIYDNTADQGGGLYFSGDDGTAQVLQSTIAMNIANDVGGGIGTRAAITISSSTIAYNDAHRTAGGGGVTIMAQNALELESTLVAENSSGADIASRTGATIIASGANNLVMSASHVTMPAGTINADPRLRNFGDHGGSTWTFSLYSNSPAINAGNNVANRTYDQRGPGYPRVLLGAPDIGAFESVYSPP